MTTPDDVVLCSRCADSPLLPDGGRPSDRYNVSLHCPLCRSCYSVSRGRRRCFNMLVSACDQFDVNKKVNYSACGYVITVKKYRRRNLPAAEVRVDVSDHYRVALVQEPRLWVPVVYGGEGWRKGVDVETLELVLTDWLFDRKLPLHFCDWCARCWVSPDAHEGINRFCAQCRSNRLMKLTEETTADPSYRKNEHYHWLDDLQPQITKTLAPRYLRHYSI